MERFDDIPAMMLVADVEGGAIQLNKAARDYLGYSVLECDELALTDVVVADVEPGSRSSIQSLLNQKMTVRATRRLYHKDRSISEATGTAWMGFWEGREVLYSVFQPIIRKTPETLVQEALIYVSTVWENSGSDTNPLLELVFKHVDWREMSNTLAQLLILVFGRWGCDVDETSRTLFQEFCSDIAMIETPAI